MTSTSYADNDPLVFITIDIDWAPEPVLEDMESLLHSLSIPATIFTTHASETIARLQHTSSVEVGLHPNFNTCLAKNGPARDAETILAETKKLAPTATAIRCHSLMQSSRLFALFRDHGLTHEVNTFVPFASCRKLEPWRHPMGITSVPFLWEDDFACLEMPMPLSPLPALELQGIKVFNFHPIHLYLNTIRLADYETAKKSFFEPEAMDPLRRPEGSNGIRDLFLSLTNAAKQKEFGFGLVSQVQAT